MDTDEKQQFETWAIVELFGRQQMAGLVKEQVIASQGFIRVDVPAIGDRPGFTRFFGPGAIYSIIPTDEETARRFAANVHSAPISPYQVALPSPRRTYDETDENLEEGA